MLLTPNGEDETLNVEKTHCWFGNDKYELPTVLFVITFLRKKILFNRPQDVLEAVSFRQLTQLFGKASTDMASM